MATATPRTQRRYLSLDEAAEMAGVHKITVRRWITQGRIRGYRVGPRLLRVDVDDMEALLQPIGA